MDQILGQDRAIEQLQAALGSGRVHHAWIFAGPRGVGKFTTAVEFARLLLDPQAAPDLAGRIAADPAGRSSQLIDAGTHPDLHILRKEDALLADTATLRTRKLLNIPVDLIRERIIGGRTNDDRIHEAPAYRTPMFGHGKVFIIDEADLMDRVAQNALLKTLEEPPRRTHFILITAQPDDLLPTTLSRSQLVRFAPLDEKSMRQWFSRSGIQLRGEEADWVADFAEGSPGVASVAAAYGFHRWQTTLEPMLRELERGRFPAAMGGALAEMVEEFATAWVKANRNASKDAANKDGAGHVFSLLAAHARRRIASCVQTRADPVPWAEAIDRIHDAELALDSNVNVRLVMENLVAQWAQTPAAVN